MAFGMFNSWVVGASWPQRQVAKAAQGAQAAQTEVVPQLRRRQCLQAASAAGLGAAGAMASGCTFAPDWDHDGPDAPDSAALARPARVAWVFSSGGPRGFVHVGVLKALAELRLAPDVLVGASVGALVAVLRASGMSAADIESLALELGPMQMARLNFAGSERLSGSAVADFVRSHVRVPLQQMPLPAVCTAQRLADGQVVGFNRGDAGIAVQASAAIVGSFSPVRIRGQRYADADLAMPLPVRVARALGATRVLAIDASAHEDKAPEGSQRYREGDLRKRALTRPDAALADLVLHPHFGYWVNLTREFRLRAMQAGYEATIAEATRLRALHAT